MLVAMNEEAKVGRSGPRKEETGLREMTDLRIWKQRREEIMHEVERDRLVRALRAARKRRSGQIWAVAWKTKRYAGRLARLLRLLGVPRRLP